MRAVQMLVDGKNDSELLNTVVVCLTDNDEDLIAKLRDATGYDNRQRANVEVLVSIVDAVKRRVMAASAPITEIQPDKAK